MLFEILLIVFCVAIVAGVIISSIVRRKQGKCSGDCGCDCSHCAMCHQAQKNERK